MAKRGPVRNMSSGIHWRRTEEGFIPRFVWKKLEVEGSVRPVQLLYPQEAFQVIMEFANAAGKGIFGVAPYKTVTDSEGHEVFASNEAFDAIPNMKDVLGGLKNPADIEIKGAEQSAKENLVTPGGIPLDQIDPNS